MTKLQASPGSSDSKRWRDRYSWLFCNYRWWRKFVGGKWSHWLTSLPMPSVWVRGWERPGCGERCWEREDWHV
jgi:hypothetical protein